MKKILNMTDLRPGFTNKCNGCKFNKGNNPGTHHISCGKKNAIVTVNEHARANGWASWPFDYDVIWLESCDSYTNDTQYDNLNDLEQRMLIQGFVLYTQEKIQAFKKWSEMSHGIKQQNNLLIAINLLNEINVFLDSISGYKDFILNTNDLNEEQKVIVKETLYKISKL